MPHNIPTRYLRHLCIFCYIMVLSLATYAQDRSSSVNTAPLQVIQDLPFVQDYSIKYQYRDSVATIRKVVSDRNGNIQILSSQGLLMPANGFFLSDGILTEDRYYRTMSLKSVSAIGLKENQFIYADDRAILSNAWAGRLYIPHTVEHPVYLINGKNNVFLIGDNGQIQLIKDDQVVWEKSIPAIIDITHDENTDRYWILTAEALYYIDTDRMKMIHAINGHNFTCLEIIPQDDHILIGTPDGLLTISQKNLNRSPEVNRKLPATEITVITAINDRIWIGTNRGAFVKNKKGKYDYYAGRRWLLDDEIVDIAQGPNHSVLLLSKTGLNHIIFDSMTLANKAELYDRQVRNRHIRYGFNATLSGLRDGDISTGFLSDSDNDGLWTSMYLAAEVFRYKVTQSREALDNIHASLDAMERLYDINPVQGFPSRSFERSGIKKHLADPDRWHTAQNPEWEWKGTTSSDEAIGHVFVFSVIAELIDDPNLKNRAIQLLDMLMQHIVDNDMRLIDYDGQPTTWGRWYPEYVNARPKMVGDRKLNSSNIIAMLQSAYHFTRKEVYKQKALELMDEHGYLDNLMRPISTIASAPDDADDWSKMLSEEWNHSDDEMYYLGYWCLYRYAFTPQLKATYKEAIIDHWQAERPEEEGLWNIMTTITGKYDYDISNAIEYLRQYPLDLVHWTVSNSHRRDLDFVDDNFRNQTIEEVLPPDELPISRHNANRFRLDGGDGGRSEFSAGDIWLLPYWMGRYLGVISPPSKKFYLKYSINNY